MIFYTFGMRHLASQRFVSRKTTFLCFFQPYYHFSAFFRIKKDAPWNSASIGPSLSPWTPIFDHFVPFLIISVPKQPGLKLKSDKMEHTGAFWNGLILKQLPQNRSKRNLAQYISWGNLASPRMGALERWFLFEIDMA